MRRKPGRPPEEKIQIRVDRLQEALDRKKIVLRKLCDTPGAPIAEKTIRRAKESGFMTAKSLNCLAEFLDVDPFFLMEETHQRAEKLAKDEKELEEIRNSLTIDRFPYLNKLKREQDSFKVIEEILIQNNIDPKGFYNLPSAEQVRIYIEFHQAASRVILKHFKKDSPSEQEYSMPMPPDEEIVTMK